MCCDNQGGMGNLIVGMMAGMVAGVAVGMSLCPSRREMKKMANNAAKHMNDMVSHLTDSMGM